MADRDLALARVLHALGADDLLPDIAGFYWPPAPPPGLGNPGDEFFIAPDIWGNLTTGQQGTLDELLVRLAGVATGGPRQADGPDRRKSRPAQAGSARASSVRLSPPAPRDPAAAAQCGGSSAAGHEGAVAGSEAARCALPPFTPVVDTLLERYGPMGALVAGIVWRFAQQDSGVCRASVETIAARLHVGPRTVLRHLQRLRCDGVLEDLTPGRRNAPHEYRIQLPGGDRGHGAARTAGRPQPVCQNVTPAGEAVCQNGQAARAGVPKSHLKRLSSPVDTIDRDVTTNVCAPHGAQTPTRGAGRATRGARTPTAEEREHTALTRALLRHFVQVSGREPPRRDGNGAGKGFYTVWWNPLREIGRLAGWDEGRGRELITEAVRAMREARPRPLVIKGPCSIVSHVQDMVARQGAGRDRRRYITGRYADRVKW